MRCFKARLAAVALEYSGKGLPISSLRSKYAEVRATHGLRERQLLRGRLPYLAYALILAHELTMPRTPLPSCLGVARCAEDPASISLWAASTPLTLADARAL